MVDLETLSHVTAGDDTRLVSGHEGPLQGGPDGPAQVGDRGDVGPLGDDQVQDGIAEERPGRL